MGMSGEVSDEQGPVESSEATKDRFFSPAALRIVNTLGLPSRYSGDSFGAGLAWHNGLIITSEEEDSLLTPRELAQKYPWLAYLYSEKK